MLYSFKKIICIKICTTWNKIGEKYTTSFLKKTVFIEHLIHTSRKILLK